MKRRWMAVAVAASALGATLLGASGASAATFDCNMPLDNFNRAPSATLGSNWIQQASTVGIEANSATNPSATPGLATWKVVPSTQQACVDVSSNGTGLQYAALTLGFGDTVNNAFVKVQNAGGDPNFETVWVYYGNNGDCKVVDADCSTSVTPFAAARLHAALDPVTGAVTLDIDTNFDNVVDQSVSETYTAPTSFGNAIGLGIYGHSFADDFATVAPPPPPPPPAVPPAATPPAVTPSGVIKPKPRKCRKGHVKKKVKGKVRCVKKQGKKRAKKG